MKKLIRYGVLLVLGLSFVVYGMVDLAVSRYSPEPLSDAQIIERAKDLGMVDVKEQWIESKDKNENRD